MVKKVRNLSASAAAALVGLAISAGLVAALHMGKIPGALPQISDDLSLSLTESGLIVSSFSLLAALCGLAIGIFSSQLGMLRAGTLGLLLVAIGSGLGGASDGFAGLLGTRVIEGLGFVLVAITMPGVINLVCPAPWRSLALGIWGAFIPAAMSLALLLSPPVLATVGWQGLWLGVAMLSLIWCLLFAAGFWRVSLSPPGQGTSWRATGPLMRRGPLAVVAIFTCYSMAFAAFTAFLPTYWVGRGASLGDASRLAALAVAGNIVGNITAGYLIGRGITLSMLSRIAMIGAGFCAALVFSGALSLRAEFIAAVGFTAISGLLPGATMASLARIAVDPARIPLLVGMVFQGAGIGQVIGPVALGSAVALYGGWGGAVGLFLGIAALATLLGSLHR